MRIFDTEKYGGTKFGFFFRKTRYIGLDPLAGVTCARVLGANAYMVAAGAGTPVLERGSCADDGVWGLSPACAGVALAAHSPALETITM